MSKQFDYYAGYPNQRKTPKWIGVMLGSLFGTMALLVVAIGVRLLVPARVAEASDAKPVAAAPVTPEANTILAPAADATAAVATADADSSDVKASPVRRGKGKHGKIARGAVAKAPAKAMKETKQYKHAQTFAKSVSASSHRDRKARAELDKMLGL
jgi:hypothetical protein